MANAPDLSSKTEFLATPKGHQRNESAYSQNYSILDYYDADTPSVIRGTGAELERSTSFENALESSSLQSLRLQDTGLRSSLRSDPLHEPDSSTDPVPDGDTSAVGSSSFASSNHKIALLKSDTESANQNSSFASPVITHTGTHWVPPQISPTTEDNLRAVLKSKVDMYGFRKQSLLFDATEDSYNEWFSEYQPHLLHQKKKWIMLMKHNGLSANKNSAPPSRFPPKSDKVKKMIRKGIPPEWRGNAWFFYAGGHEKLNQNTGLYDELVAATKGIQNKDTEVIERDLNRTFPDNVHFNPSVLLDEDATTQPETPAILALRRVLVAIAHYQPHIGYCQSLNFLAGLLLLFMNEERAFWMLVIMIERIIPKVHAANLEGVHTDQGVLMMCIREYIPKLWAIIGKSYDGTVLPDDKILTRLPPVTLVTSSWFMSVFVGVLPIESVLRVWDIIWYEGSKTIFRVSLTICRLCMDHPNFLKRKASKSNNEGSESDQIELFQFMQSFPKSITDPNLIIDSCFKKIGGYGYGFVSQDEINKCREFVSQQRDKIKARQQSVVGPEMTEEERQALAHSVDLEEEIHDIYGFNKSIMGGIAWNRHISNRMKKKFSKKLK